MNKRKEINHLKDINCSVVLDEQTNKILSNKINDI